MKERALPSPSADEEMQLDQIPKEESDDEGGLVLDDTSEFVKGINLQPALPKKIPPPTASSSTLPSASAMPLEEIVTDVKMEEVEEGETRMDIDDQAEEARLLFGENAQIKKEEDETNAALGGTGSELLISGGMGATMALLKQSGLMKPLTAEEIANEREYKDKQRWLAKRREDDAKVAAQKSASRAAGSSKDQHQREMENKQRDREQAAKDLDRFKDYKPNIDIKYTDEFGREMSKKEAWK